MSGPADPGWRPRLVALDIDGTIVDHDGVMPEAVREAVRMVVDGWVQGAGGRCAALGDGRNDIEMVRWAGHGVALGDAPAEARLAADHVTGWFVEGGTVRELRRWFG
jgi:hydroxymethylpyrimidine pyrophosphatase-like HAD family hydrolase